MHLIPLLSCNIHHVHYLPLIYHKLFSKASFGCQKASTKYELYSYYYYYYFIFCFYELNFYIFSQWIVQSVQLLIYVVRNKHKLIAKVHIVDRVLCLQCCVYYSSCFSWSQEMTILRKLLLLHCSCVCVQSCCWHS